MAVADDRAYIEPAALLNVYARILAQHEGGKAAGPNVQAEIAFDGDALEPAVELR